MDTNQARSLLRKINQLFDTVSDSPGGAARIEADLLKEYVRQFYTALDTFEPSAVPFRNPVHGTSPHDRPVPEAVQTTTEAPALPEPPMDLDPSTTPHPEPEPQVIPEPEPEPVPEPEPMVMTPVVAASQAPASAVVSTDRATQALFEMDEVRELSDKLRHRPVDDLSRAMGINERFLTINELFNGDHEAFDRTLRQLNDLPSFEAARTYMEDQVIPRYDWMDRSRMKKAQIFIQLVRRRYL